MRTLPWIIAVPLPLAVAACGPTVRSVHDPDPAEKIPAIKEAVSRHDRRVIPQLVKDLESDDPAIRFYAIDGLHQLTGQDLGYRYYEEPEARQPAIEKWKQWLAGHGTK